MIFVTVGTEKFQFNRILEVLDRALGKGEIKDKVFAQIGYSDYKPRNFSSVPFLSFNELVENIRIADVFVSHAAGGTLVLSLSLGRKPILFPRRAFLGEHLDDHQLISAKEFDSTGLAFVAFSETDLIEKIKDYKSLCNKYPLPPSELPRLVNFLRGLSK